MSDYLGRECMVCGEDPLMWFGFPDGVEYACQQHAAGVEQAARSEAEMQDGELGE